MKLPNSRFWLSIFMTGLAICQLLIFIGVWAWGRYYIQEPNLPIRIFETIGLVGIIIFGFVQFIKSLREDK